MDIKEFKPGFFLIFIFLVLGCSVPVSYYIRNITESPVLISLKIRQGAVEMEKSRMFLAKEELFNIRHNLYKRLDDTLVAQKINEQLITLTLPAHSTIFIGKGTNFTNFEFTGVIVESSIKRDTINIENVNKLNKKKEFLNKYSLWYDIK